MMLRGDGHGARFAIAGAVALVVGGEACKPADRNHAAGAEADGVAPIALLDAAADGAPRMVAQPEAGAGPSAEPVASASARAEEETPAAGDKGPVRVGALTVSGGLGQEAVSKAVRAQLPKLRRCYETAAAKAPGQKGQLKVRLAIDREGSVTTAGNGGTDLQDDALVECVLRAFWSMKFPQPKDGIVLVVLPLRFGVP